MLFVLEEVCDENNYMTCYNGWDESNCAVSEGEQFYFGSILDSM